MRGEDAQYQRWVEELSARAKDDETLDDMFDRVLDVFDAQEATSTEDEGQHE